MNRGTGVLLELDNIINPLLPVPWRVLVGEQ
jgi:hypothetical protein